VLALASELTRFVTGQIIVADGGLSLTTARPHRGQVG
jgi:enoyl-[acyl-carrier-protein] reductase (NADH)